MTTYPPPEGRIAPALADELRMYSATTTAPGRSRQLALAADRLDRSTRLLRQAAAEQAAGGRIEQATLNAITDYLQEVAQ